VSFKIVPAVKSKNVDFYTGESRLDNNETLIKEIDDINPSHIITFTGRTHGEIDGKKYTTIDYLEQEGKLLENVRDNLYSPILLAELCKQRKIHYSYLGTGWTACTPEQENKITIRHQLTMTTGLNDGVKDNHCTLDTCLTYLAQPGARWAYHNAPYTLLEKVITTATKKAINTYTNEKLKQKTGITGVWAFSGYDNVFYSKVRSMARFGLLMQNNGIWNVDTLLRDTAYMRQMTTTSQQKNLSYGYLWWLNGKNSYMVPTLQTVIKGPYAPAAPSDMFAGLGKNGQILSVSKSLGLVVIRMGNQVNSGEVPTQLCNKIWEKLQAAMCQQVDVNELNLEKDNVFGYTKGSELILTLPSDENNEIEIRNAMGQLLLKSHNESTIDISHLTEGLYFLTVKQGQKSYKQKFWKC